MHVDIITQPDTQRLLTQGNSDVNGDISKGERDRTYAICTFSNFFKIISNKMVSIIIRFSKDMSCTSANHIRLSHNTSDKK
jgi:hypothetical protein